MKNERLVFGSLAYEMEKMQIGQYFHCDQNNVISCGTNGQLWAELRLIRREKTGLHEQEKVDCDFELLFSDIVRVRNPDDNNKRVAQNPSVGFPLTRHLARVHKALKVWMTRLSS